MRFKHIIIATILLGGCTTQEGSSDSEGSAENTPAFLSSFDYQPESPTDGKLLGIIELGYSGFNSFIVSIDNEDRWALEKAIYDESKVGDGKVTFDHVISKIKEFRTEMIEFGVNENDINLVASSSALRDQKVVEIAEKLRGLDIGLITIDATQEGRYAFLATVPKEFQKSSFMVDIGSGNTKISWFEGTEIRSIETVGSRYFESGVSDQQARIGIKEALATVPPENKNICFMVGGLPHLLANSTDNRNSRYTILEPPEEYTFSERPEQAGLNLYDALWQEATIAYVFDWDSNFSIGVLMNVN